MNEDRIRIYEILTATDRTLAYTQDGREALDASLMMQDAVLRNLDVISESCKRLTSGLKEQHPDVPWEDLAGLYDRVVTDDYCVDWNHAWDVISEQFPVLSQQLQEIEAQVNQSA